MSPIPANASMAMLFSFFVAVTVTPWLLLRIARRRFMGRAPERGACTTSARWGGSIVASRGRC